MNVKYIELYIQRVKSILPFFTKNEKLFLKNLKIQITKAFENHEISNYETLLDLFGSPSDIVSSYVYELEYEDIQKSLNNKKLHSIYIAFIISIMIIVAGFRIYLLNKEYHDVSEGTIVYEESFIVDNSTTEGKN